MIRRQRTPIGLTPQESKAYLDMSKIASDQMMDFQNESDVFLKSVVKEAIVGSFTPVCKDHNLTPEETEFVKLKLQKEFRIRFKP